MIFIPLSDISSEFSPAALEKEQTTKLFPATTAQVPSLTGTITNFNQQYMLSVRDFAALTLQDDSLLIDQQKK
jgi:hypothetical protein